MHPTKDNTPNEIRRVPMGTEGGYRLAFAVCLGLSGSQMRCQPLTHSSHCRFTALGNLYLIHESIVRVVEVYDFQVSFNSFRCTATIVIVAFDLSFFRPHSAVFLRRPCLFYFPCIIPMIHACACVRSCEERGLRTNIRLSPVCSLPPPSSDQRKQIRVWETRP